MSSEGVLDLSNCQPVSLGSEWQNSYPILLRKARRLAAGGTQDPEDLVSQATVKVLNYLNLEREADNFVGLMLVSLLQVYLDGNRKRANRILSTAVELTEEYDFGDHSCAERSYLAKETLGDIFDFLATMPASTQELFRHRFVSDLSYAEIGLTMGMTEACARQKVKKLRQKLQTWIEE